MVEAFELTGIGPPAAQHVVLEIAGLDVGVVHVGDFQFVALRGPEPADIVEHALIVEIDAAHGIVARRHGRLFVDPDDARSVERRHPEAFGIRNLLEEDSRSRRLFFKAARVGPDVVLEDVVAEHDADPVAVGEIFAQSQRVGDPAFAVLIRIVDVLEAEVFSIPEQSQEVARRVPAGNEHDLFETGAAQRFERIVDHRLVVHRQQMLVRHLGERTKSSSEAAREDDALHARRPEYWRS